MRNAKHLFDELSYWIQIGIADDIVTASAHRPEYQHLVKRWKKLSPENIPGAVVKDLYLESQFPVILQPTFWVLLKISFKKKIKRFFRIP